MIKGTAAVSRRNFLKGLGVGALGLAGAQLPNLAEAQTLASTAAISGFYRTTLGDFDITILNDGFIDFPPDMFAANMPAGTYGNLLQLNGMPAETATIPIAVLLVQTGDRTILFDTGIGDLQGGIMGTNNGKLLSSLEFMGIDPGSVTDLIISHWHPDHVGAISLAGQVSFPNAQHYFPQAEWDFLNGPPVGDETVDGLIAVAKSKLEPAVSGDQVMFFGDEEELVTGVQTLFTPGHSPGHYSFMLSSAGKQLLLTVDSPVGPSIGLQHPEWSFVFDAIPELAVASRRQIFGRAADENLQVFSNHFAFPGLGYVTRDGDRFRFLSQS